MNTHLILCGLSIVGSVVLFYLYYNARKETKECETCLNSYTSNQACYVCPSLRWKRNTYLICGVVLLASGLFCYFYNTSSIGSRLPRYSQTEKLR